MSSSKIALVIQVCYEQLVEGGLYSEKLVTRLYSESHITAEDMEQVNRSGLTSFDRSRRLLDILRNKSNSVLDTLLAFLHEDGTQPHLEKALFDAAVKVGYYQAKGVKLKHETGGSPGPSWPAPTETAVLPEKWWPHHKPLIRSFVKRTGPNGQLLVHQLRDQLCSDEELEKGMVANKVVIVGMGGIGKTSIAKWYANEHEEHYYHIIWLDCEGSSLTTSFHKLREYLILLPNSKRSFNQLVSEIYEKYKGTHCLFIFDNAERFDGRNGLKDILPTQKSHHALITSRNHDWGNPNEFGRIFTFQLDVFTEFECASLLSSQLGPLGKCKDHGKILELGIVLGFLPLALQCAVATIVKSRRYDLSSYLARIKEDLKILLDKKILSEYERSISATVQLSIQQIQDDDEIDDECREFCELILNMAAYCEPSDIPENMFYGPTHARPSLVADAIDQLVTYSLLSPEKQVGSKADHLFRMHRLFQHVIRLKLVEDKQACEVVKLILECLQVDLNKFYVHAAHAWSTVSACPQLDEMQVSCHQFPYELSLQRQTVSETDFLHISIDKMRRVYQASDLPLVQLRLRQIELLCKLPSDHATARHVYDELLKEVKANVEMPFIGQLLLHLRIFATELMWKFGVQLEGKTTCLKQKQDYILQSYQDALQDMNELQYDGEVGGHTLHFVQYKVETGYNKLSLEDRVVLNCAHLLSSRGEKGQALEMLTSHITQKTLKQDVHTIWSIVNFLIEEHDLELICTLTPTLNGLLESNRHHPTPNQFLNYSSEFCPQVVFSVSTIKDYCVKTLQRTNKIKQTATAIPQILEIVKFQLLTLQVSTGEIQWLVEILASITQVVDTIFECQREEGTLGSRDFIRQSLIPELDMVWSYWTDTLEKIKQTPPNWSHELPFSALLALNTSYTFMLMAAGQEMRILEVDAETKDLLHSGNIQWRSLHKRTNDHYLYSEGSGGCGSISTIARICTAADWLDGARVRGPILRSKLDIVLYIIESSTKMDVLVHNWKTEPFHSLLVAYDNACYLHFSLDEWKRAKGLWYDSIKLMVAFKNIHIGLITRAGQHTLAWLESVKEGSTTFKQFMMSIGDPVAVLLEQQKSMYWIADPLGILQLLMRLVKHRLYKTAGEIISRLEFGNDFVPLNDIDQRSFGTVKGILPDILKLSEIFPQNVQDNLHDIMIMGKLNGIKKMYSKENDG